jgi:beta-galactosidase
MRRRASAIARALYGFGKNRDRAGGALDMLMALLCRKAGLATIELPTEVRLRRRGDLTFAFNYGGTPWHAPFSGEPLLGEPEVMPRNFTVWQS